MDWYELWNDQQYDAMAVLQPTDLSSLWSARSMTEFSLPVGAPYWVRNIWLLTVPEPSTVLMLLSAISASFLVRRRQCS